MFVPVDEGYHDARRVWNGGIDRRPAVITCCESAADVAAAIDFALQQDLEISVRGGGHNVWGAAVSTGGMMIHLGGMNGVSVDPAARRVRVGGGALLADMDAATQAHGLATTTGMVSHTGVGGLTLGGGFGWLAHRHGLAIDNLLSAEIVTADGQVLRASQEDNPDLFWALRGGGGNFGVVTEFEFRLHEVGPMVDFGLFFFDLDHAAEALRLGRELATAVSRDVTVLISVLNAPPASFVPAQYHFQPGYAVLAAGFGQGDEHARIAARIRESGPPLFEFVSPMRYVQLQQLLDQANAWGLHCYEKGLYLDELSDAVIAVITEQVRGKSAPLSYTVLVPMDGAYRDMGDDDTAWGGSRSGYMIFIVGLATTSELLDADRRWVRSFWQALLPHAHGTGCYVNGLAQFEEERVRASYGPVKYERLARTKAIYDPENIFHRNANINRRRPQVERDRWSSSGSGGYM
ncbi:MAG: FAD-binding oxidoreductase [Actinomycetota bacterium]|nr:FAD-binding oxidoreductase [Actinomycetota bacterium]